MVDLVGRPHAMHVVSGETMRQIEMAIDVNDDPAVFFILVPGDLTGFVPLSAIDPPPEQPGFRIVGKKFRQARVS